MTEVEPTDNPNLLQLKKLEYNSIERSRKRKLRQLFAVATQTDGIPDNSFGNPDKPPPSAAESAFLEGCDISKGRRLEEKAIPPRPPIRYNAIAEPWLSGPSSSDHSRLASSSGSMSDESENRRQWDKESSLPGWGRRDGTGRQSMSGLASGHQPKVDVAIHPSATGNINANATVTSSQLPATNGHSSLAQVQNGTIGTGHSGRPALRGTVANGAVHAAPGASSPHHRPEKLPQLAPPDRAAQEAAAQPLRDKDVQPVTAGSKTLSGLGPCIGGKDGARDMDDPVPTLYSAQTVGASQPSMPQEELCRSGDAPSSPETMTQTPTSPAVLDTSTHTSPVHDSMNYVEQAGSAANVGGHNKGAHDECGGKIPVSIMSEEALGIDTTRMPEETCAKAPSLSGPSFAKSESEVREVPAQQPDSKVPRATVHERDKQAAGIQDVWPTAAEQSGPVSENPVVVDTLMTEAPVEGQTGQDGGNREKSPRAYQTTAAAASTHGATTVEHVTPHGYENVVPRDKPHVTQVPRAANSPIIQDSDRAVTRVSTGAIRQKSVSDILFGAPLLTAARVKQKRPRSRAPSTPHKASLKGKSKLSVVFRQPRPEPAEVRRPPNRGELPFNDYFMPLFIQGYANSPHSWMKPLDQVLRNAHKTVSTPDSYLHLLDSQACKVLRRVYQAQQQDKWSLRQPKRSPEAPRPESQWDVLLKEAKWLWTDVRQERRWRTAACRKLAYSCCGWHDLKDQPDAQKHLIVKASSPDHPPPPMWLKLNREYPHGSMRFLELDWHGKVNDDAMEIDDSPLPDVTIAAVSAGLKPKKGDGVEMMATDDSPSQTPSTVAPADLSVTKGAEHHDSLLEATPPFALFALPNDDVVFGLDPSPTTDRLLAELPLFGRPLQVPRTATTFPQKDPDAHWKRPALPVSRYVEGSIELIENKPPRRRSRYRHSREDDETDMAFTQEPDESGILPSKNTDVALFQPENKAMRDRLQAAHQFRPPSEHTMPPQTFYESRSSSQWLTQEDDELRRLVREHSYNWALIASMTCMKSLFTSCAERRTSWECFERWVMLESLPSDMCRTQYFRLWQNRIDSAQQVIRQQSATQQQQQQQQHQQHQQHHQQQQQQQLPQSQGGSGPAAPAPGAQVHMRRRLSLPIRVDRRRNQKHMTLLDGMRKLAKKRENVAAKQQQTASLSAIRKAQESTLQHPRLPSRTPEEYSNLRWERDRVIAEKLADRMAQRDAQQRQEGQRRPRNGAADGPSGAKNGGSAQIAMQARAQQGQSNAQIAPNNGPVHQNSALIAVTHPHNMARVNATTQMRSRATASMRGGLMGGLVPSIAVNGNGQGQMPAVMSNGYPKMNTPTSQADMNLVIQAQRISDQQRIAVDQRMVVERMRQGHQHQTQPMQQGNTSLQHPAQAVRAAASASGTNQRSYISNTQAQGVMTAFPPAGSPGLPTAASAPSHPPSASSPVSGLHMPGAQAESPTPRSTPCMPQQQVHQTYLSQLQQIESHLRQNYPGVPQDKVRDVAKTYLQQRTQNHTQAVALQAVAAGSSVAAPQQYAQFMRQHQLVQSAAQHQRQASSGVGTSQNNAATHGSPTPPATNGSLPSTSN